MKPYYLLLIIFASLASCNELDTSVQTFAPIPNEENTEAQKQLSYLSELIRDNPSQADLYYKRACLNHDLSRFRTALIDIETCLKIKGVTGELLFWKAKILAGLKDYEQALAIANQAIEMGVNHTDMDILFGQLQYHNGNAADALPYLENAYSIFPQDPTTAYYLGAIFDDRQDTSSAIREFNQAVRLKPDYTDAYLRLIRLYSRYELVDHSGETVAKALESCPPNAGVYQELGNWLWEQNFLDSAAYWYRQSLQLRPASWIANYRMALYYIAQKEYVLAESYYTEALAYNPNIPGGYFQIGYIYEFYLNQLEEAQQAYQKGKRIDRENAQALTESLERLKRKMGTQLNSD